MAAIGVDGCKGGWVAVVLDGGDRTARAHRLGTIAELDSISGRGDVIGLDMPIHFPREGIRRSEIELRAALGPRRSSVFRTPPRGVLEADTYETANELCRQLSGSGLSRQSYGLRAAILQVVGWLDSDPGPAVHEVHPEGSFAAMLGAPARASKKTWGGMRERMDALVDHGVDLGRVNSAVADWAGTDDLIDAAAAAWTATRIIAGTAHRYGDGDDTIWA